MERPPTGALNVEVLGPWVQNKGDDLMLRAVVERLADSVVLAASSDLGGDGFDRTFRRIEWRPTLGQYALAARHRSLGEGLDLVRRTARLAVASPSRLEARGIVEGRRLDALLDCSGFAYGDQWSTRRVNVRAAYYDRLRQSGARLVLLPQALGPFERPEVRDGVRRMLAPFDLVYARDEVSLKHVWSLGLGGVRVERAPDITHLLDGQPPSDPDAWARRVCVVPNARMLDKTPREVSARYVDFVVSAIGTARGAGLEPVLVLHETNDVDLVAEILRRVDGEVPVFDEDAVVTKGYLGACYANVGSRYHSLVSSLSQGTPSLGTSWTHKYGALFAEYGVPELSLSLRGDDADLDRTLAEVLAPERQGPLRRQLAAAAASQKEKVESMWQAVENVLHRR